MIDKRIKYRFGGDTMKRSGRMDQMGGKPGLTAAQIRAVDPIGYGGGLKGPAFVGSGDSGSGGDGVTKKKKTPVKTVLKKGVDYARKNPLQVLLSFLNPVFGLAIGGANFLNDPERRKRLTGYETQEEYDQARQDRINLNRIKTLENTIQKKYLDKNRSLDETNLDERLAALKSQMGITPNTAADLRPDLDFSNLPELAFEGTKSTSPGITSIPFSADKTVDELNLFNVAPNFGGTVLTDEFPSTPPTVRDDNVPLPPNLDLGNPNMLMADAAIDNRTLLEKLLNPNLNVDEALDQEEEKRKREQELLQQIMQS
jgi:hypothetical protein|tara:strand:+ start:108 stop:1049 length:942 start_codon:yes stop_codon:yes gene_type:complete